MQDPEIADKNSRSRRGHKPYTLPSGKVISLQGYEPQVLDELFKSGFSESEILFSKKDQPTVWYELDGKRHRYFSDFYLPRFKQILEVKSPYTLKADWKENLAKRQACIAAGYSFNFIVRNF